MTAIDWACGNCAQQPGEPCIDLLGNALPYFHAERIETAAIHSGQSGETATKAQFDAAVIGSGLV